jgi:hypothetical protein
LREKYREMCNFLAPNKCRLNILQTGIIHFSELQHGRAGMEDWYTSLRDHAPDNDRFTKSARARLGKEQIKNTF